MAPEGKVGTDAFVTIREAIAATGTPDKVETRLGTLDFKDGAPLIFLTGSR